MLSKRSSLKNNYELRNKKLSKPHSINPLDLTTGQVVKIMNKTEIKVCQNCKNKFTIEPEDFNFYQKMKVPPPTWCPECRLTRRLIWRNERNLIKRACDFCKKEILSVYRDDVLFPVYCPECWQGDGWDPLNHGQGYNFSKPFFTQFQKLFSNVPRPARSQNGTNVNCDYANIIQDVKNVYFSFSIIWGSEDVYYSNNVNKSKQIFDSLNIADSELVYESIGSTKNYQCSYCYWSSGCIDCTFIMDSTGCSNCFCCIGLRNRQYCIFNEQYSKEEYKKRIKLLGIGSHKGFIELERKFNKFINKIPRRYARIVSSVGCTGDEILNSKNAQNVFNVSNVEDAKYLFRCPGGKQVMDACHLGNVEFVYEHAMGGSDPGQELKFIIYGMPGQHHVSYSDYCNFSSYLFGCIGLKNKKYCILNKQYTKEVYEDLVSKIITHMNKMPYVDSYGRTFSYGEFFPPELSPFAYNESVMQEYVPLTKKRAIESGYQWKEKEKHQYQITLTTEKLMDDIKDTPNSITSEVIGCFNQGKTEWCTKAFRIVPEEFAFYKRMNIALPRHCPNCRHFARLAKKNPIKLWTRPCYCAGDQSDNKIYQNTISHFHKDEHCPNEFETSYTPESKEIIYCKKCYQSEII